ncbi:MAG: cupin domain-containing protein [Lachnospiraceae bacterium]|nr:cupin domain-containing protein [Lachnospiraceae bacterium]
MQSVKDRIWNEYAAIDAEKTGPGVVRKILAYTDELMIVENQFEAGAVGALHHHPHTQITYVVSGQFEFEINGEKRIVNAGDSMLKKDGIVHGCVCLQKGVLLDIFSPMREDFVAQD